MGQESGGEKIGRSHAAIKVRALSSPLPAEQQLCHMWEKTLGVIHSQRHLLHRRTTALERKYRSNWISLSHYFQHLRKTEER